MSATLLTLLTAATIGLPPAEYPHRIDPGAAERVATLHPYVRQAEHNTDVPPKVLLGVLYTESNGHPWIVGDGGRAIGLGQIHCRHWRELLDGQCERLRDAEFSVYATATILDHLKRRYGGSWRDVARMYNAGTAARYDGSVADGYADKVAHFGKLWGRQYEVSKRLEAWL